MSHPYRRCSASLNSPLFNKKPCSSIIGVAASQDDAHFSLARAIWLFWSIDRTLLSSFAWQMSLRRFALLIFLLASSVSSGLTDPSRCWAVMWFTCGVVRITEALKDDWELEEGFGMPKPPSLDGRASMSLSTLEHGGRPVSAGMRI